MENILIVDDDLNFRTTLAQYLKTQGYEVSSVSSGEAGLTALNETPPDLIISDILMPGMDGLEFCRQVRLNSSAKLTPFIFLSGCGELQERIQGHQIGADDYLVKPFDFQELAAKINAQLDRVKRVQAEMTHLIQEATAAAHSQATPAPLPLTPSEEKVFFEVIQGYTNKQIGDRLCVSPRTVQTHLSNILGKLNLVNRSQLVRFAFEHGYRPPAEEHP